MRRPGRGDNDVRGYGLVHKFVIRDRRTVEFFCQLLGVAQITVADKNSFGAFIDQMPGGQFAHSAGAEY